MAVHEIQLIDPIADEIIEGDMTSFIETDDDQYTLIGKVMVGDTIKFVRMSNPEEFVEVPVLELDQVEIPSLGKGLLINFREFDSDEV